MRAGGNPATKQQTNSYKISISAYLAIYTRMPNGHNFPRKDGVIAVTAHNFPRKDGVIAVTAQHGTVH